MKTILQAIIASALGFSLFGSPVAAKPDATDVGAESKEDVMMERALRREAHETRMKKRDARLEKSRDKRKAERDKRKQEREAERKKRKSKMDSKREQARKNIKRSKPVRTR